MIILLTFFTWLVGVSSSSNLCIDDSKFGIKRLQKITKVASAVACRDICDEIEECYYWTFKDNLKLKKRICSLTTIVFKPKSGQTSGAKGCTWEWEANRIVPGGFDIARGHYPEHPIDTEYIFNLNNQVATLDCSSDYKYRTIDGSCNNVANPHWGAAGQQFQRFIDAAYEDDINEPRGGYNSALPSPRVISTDFHDQTIQVTRNDISDLFWQFGQYTSHDTGLTPEVTLDNKLSAGFNNTACATEEYRNNPKCFNIDVKSDPFYEGLLPTYPWLGNARTLPVKGTGGTSNLPRQQVNAGTGFYDCSITYGFNKTLSDQIRNTEGGQGQLIEGKEKLLPIINDTVAPSNLGLGPDVSHIAAGDPRVNVDPWLLSVQTMIFKEHNRIAKVLHNLDNSLDDETLFQKARRIVIAEYQNIVFNEFIPLVIGQSGMSKYNLYTSESSTYDPLVNPTIHNAYQTAAARFGHSLVQGKMKLQDLSTGNPEEEELYLKDNYFTNYNAGTSDDFSPESYAKILAGLTIGPCQHFDRYVTSGLRNFLYNVQGQNNYGDDIAARNIQRGRDHGLPGYFAYRKYCGLSEDTTDIRPDYTNILLSIYNNKPEDIDIWTGGLAEVPVDGAIVGPLFQCLLGQQYHNLKFGDRFFFTHNKDSNTGDVTFTEDQLQNIRGRTMRDLICQNSQSHSIRKHALEIRSNENPILCTEEINHIDFEIF